MTNTNEFDINNPGTGSIDTVVFTVNNISHLLFKTLNKNDIMFKGHLIKYDCIGYEENNGRQIGCSIRNVSSLDSNSSYILYKVGDKNRLNNVTVEVTIHLNKFIRYTYPTKEKIDSVTLFKDLGELLETAFGFKKIGFRFDMVKIQRIDYAIDMRMKFACTFYQSLLVHKNFPYLYGYRSEYGTVTFHHPRSFEKILNESDPDKVVCIYDKSKKMGLSNINILRFELSIHRSDRENKKKRIPNPCKEISSLDTIYSFDFKKYIENKVFREYLNEREINELLNKKSRKKFHLARQYSFSNPFKHIKYNLKDNISDQQIKVFLSNYNQYNLSLQLKRKNRWENSSGKELYDEFASKIKNYRIPTEAEIINVELHHINQNAFNQKKSVG
jgi:hypothetical protein